MPAQKEQQPRADREETREEDAGAALAEPGEGGTPDVQLSHAEQEALRRHLREKFH